MAQGKQEFTTQQEMSTVCIIENKRRFSQNFDTPPICDSLIAVIRYDVEKEEGKQILDWTFFPQFEHLSICRKFKTTYASLK